MNLFEQRTKGESGISLLEAAFCFVLFASLLMMGSGLWDYLDVTNALSRVTNRYAYESAAGGRDYNNGTGLYTFKLDKVKESFSGSVATPSIGLAQQALQELKQELNTINNRQLRIEFAFASVSIDAQTGLVESISPVVLADVVVAGELNVPSFLSDGDLGNGELDFDLILQGYVERAGKSLAIPSSNFGIQSRANQYIPEVPLIAVRAVYYYKSAGLLQLFGILDEPYSWDIAVAPLRGEVG